MKRTLDLRCLPNTVVAGKQGTIALVQHFEACVRGQKETSLICDVVWWVRWGVVWCVVLPWRGAVCITVVRCDVDLCGVVLLWCGAVRCGVV